LGKIAESEGDFERCLRLKPQLEPDLRKRIELARRMRASVPQRR